MVAGLSLGEERNMIRQLVLCTAAIAATCLIGIGSADAADQKIVRKAPVIAAPVAVVRVEDCSAFYDDYHERGFGWGTGPGASLGFGAFEGALPRYPRNEFPNWYGACVNWGHYSAAGGSAR
jgi:hypothetical protein